MNQIKATVIADSINTDGNRLTTFELEFPRFILPEFLTHRVFTRNASSSRAIPITTVISQVWNNPAMPIHWGRNQPGMQAKQELSTTRKFFAKLLWKTAAKAAATVAYAMHKTGLHKQVANRILEPFVLIKVVLSATDYDNFFTLRIDPDAQPEIYELAVQMRNALDDSIPQTLVQGEWHLPYIQTKRIDGKLKYYSESIELSLEQAIKVSASCCAQVSYRKLDTSLDKALKVYQRLVESKPIHASPFEHQATPTTVSSLWANFTGWVQHRKIIETNPTT